MQPYHFVYFMVFILDIKSVLFATQHNICTSVSNPGLNVRKQLALKLVDFNLNLKFSQLRYIYIVKSLR